MIRNYYKKVLNILNVFNFLLPIHAMEGKVDTVKNISEKYLFWILLSFINIYSIIDRGDVKVLITGVKIFSK